MIVNLLWKNPFEKLKEDYGDVAEASKARHEETLYKRDSAAVFIYKPQKGSGREYLQCLQSHTVKHVINSKDQSALFFATWKE